ncbi:decarboxylase [Candidatus Pacearchaeota archaeon ex4484_71]|nr:MAG: decarboxylase [Candidatus Pacearchaeota archaeon ex4484_71]
MEKAKFVLSKRVLSSQLRKLEDMGFKISYSYKTNHVVGNVLEEINEGVSFSVHSFHEVDEIKDKSRIHFFCQAETEKEFEKLLALGISSFVVDNEEDLETLLRVVANKNHKVNLGLRMKFQEHRVGSGKYFVYGMSARKVNDLIILHKENKSIKEIGIHIHRKSQNTSEWDILGELKDSIKEEVLELIDFVNFGGGLPSLYKSSTEKVFDYIFKKLKEAKEWLENRGIVSIIEPGRFLAAPSIKLITKIIQKQKHILIINTSIYNCGLDTLLTGTKMLVEGELEEEEDGINYLIKGNSPTRDDIFRYRVRLKEKNVGDEIVFLNAGAYNYSTDFFGYEKLDTEILEDFL